MADVTNKDGTTPQAGTVSEAFAVKLAAVAVRGGRALAINSAGYGIGSGIVAGDIVAGIAAKAVDNSAGSAGDETVNASIDYWCINDTTNPIGQTHLFRAPCYLVDNQPTVGSSDVGGTLAIVGTPVEIGSGTTSGKVRVRFGVLPITYLMAEKVARATATNLAAGAFSAGVFTATADGALATQDGVTCEVGDVLAVPAGTIGSATVSAANSGPYAITSLGSASSKVTLARPAWWKHGDQIPAFAIPVRAGTLFGGCSFKALCDEELVVGTGDPVFLPNRVAQSVTFNSGTSGSIANVPIRSAAKSTVEVSANATGTPPHASTRVWRPTTFTAGAIGTAALVVSAESAPGTVNASDVGIYVIAVVNW